MLIFPSLFKKKNAFFLFFVDHKTEHILAFISYL